MLSFHHSMLYCRKKIEPWHLSHEHDSLQMVLKCADIGHLSVDPVTHKRWAYQLEEEFFRQV